MMINIIPVAALQDNYIWMLIDDQQQAICIDPGEAQPVIDFLQTNHLTLKSILLTHHHYDHINGVEKLLKIAPKIPVYAPNDSRIALANHPVADKDFVRVLGMNFTVLAIPGHTSSHICYYEPHHQLLFCGDTLFSAGCGRVFDGTMDELYHSIQRLRQLPDDTKVYCAHEYTRQNLMFALFIEPDNKEALQYSQQLKVNYDKCSLPSTIGFEKLINPFFRIDDNKLRQSIHHITSGELSSFDVFSYLREQKNQFS